MTQTSRYYKVRYQTMGMMAPSTAVYGNLGDAQAHRDAVIRNNGYAKLTSITCKAGSEADAYWGDAAAWTEYKRGQ